jgi:hypothetical protein
MRNVTAAALASVLLLQGCAHAPQYDVMSAPAICDSLPTPLRPGERVGGTLPTARRPGLDSVLVIGTVLEVGSGRSLSGASISLFATTGPDRIDKPITRAVTNVDAGFLIVAPRPGRYSLVAHLIGHHPAKQEVVLRTGEMDTVRLEMHYINCIGY